METRLTQQGYTFELAPNEAQRVLLAKSVGVFPSSKLCSGCGTIKDTLGIDERQYDCDVCGLCLDRDENAAVNLRRLGLREFQLPVDRREVTPAERKALAPVVLHGAKPASLNQEASASPRSRRGTQRRDERLASAVTSWD